MIPHPYERFLGVPYDADAWALLGVPRERAELLMVDEALRARLADVFRHPDGRGVEAEQLREELRAAAAELKKQLIAQRAAQDAPPGLDLPPWMRSAVRRKGSPRAARPVQFNLTAFDKLVLSVLVACGGWNAHSRARLVALAQNYGVTVEGLLRVMQGLSEYARSGGPRIGMKDIAGVPATPAMEPVAAGAAPVVGPAILDRLAEKLGHELERGGPWPTIKLSAIFGVFTLVAGIIALRLLLRGDGAPPPPPQPPPTAVSGTAPASRPSVAPRPSGTPGTRAAAFTRIPTFLGNGLPAEAVNAVDRCPALPASLDEVARRVAVADNEVSEAVHRLWQSDVGTIATAWPLADASTRSAIDKALFEALRSAADTPAVSDRMLQSMAPPPALGAPLDLWRGAWMAGTLGRIASARSLPPVVVDRARSLLEIVLSQNVRSDITFEAAADTWLAQAIPQLVEMLPFDERRYDFWELWISAQRAVGAGDRHDAAIMRGLRDVMATDVDLMNNQPALNVAARLMQIALESNSAVVRQRMLELFDDQDLAARDLWVLTSILAVSDRTRWFPDELVTPDDADMRHRWRIRDDLAQVWPLPPVAATQLDADRTPEIDEMEGARWSKLVADRLEHRVTPEAGAIMQQLVTTSHMIEAAAALVAKVPEEARRIMLAIESGANLAPIRPTTTRPAAAAPPRSGQPIGPDGVWAAQYGQLGRAAEPRVQSLRSLQQSAGTDLGPLDAQVLVREALRGSPAEVRAEAQIIIGQQFARGPTVAMLLVDHFPDAPATDGLSEMIQALSQGLLPSPRSSTWAAEARLALVQHALSLHDLGGSPVEGALDQLTEAYVDRLGLIRREPTVSTVPTSPQEAAALLLRTLQDQAELAAPSQPTPADLPNLQRRHHLRLSLAEGPIQNFVAQQLAILDVTVYQVVAEQPRLRERALEIMRQHSANRARISSVLEQALDVERAILEIWRLRLGFDPLMRQSEDGGAM